MGTVVVSPQDCLSSPHNRQNYHFQSARRCSQALMAPLPAAEDCARQDYSGGSPPGDGLLPIPQSHGQTRAFSKRSPFCTKSSSIFSTPSPRRMTSVSPPLMKPKLSRSASAILPTPLSGSPPAVEADGSHLLKGRLPFKVVQGNGPGDKIDIEQCSNSKKFSDAQGGAHKKLVGTNRYAVKVKVKGHVDGIQGPRSTLKPFYDKGQPKQRDVRNELGLDQSHPVKGLRSKGEQEGKVPVVTILQRPQSKEAAAELLTKFFQKSKEHSEMNNEREEKQSSTEGFSDTEGSEDRKYTISSRCSTIDVWGASVNKCGEVSPVADAVHCTFPATLLTQSDVAIVSSSKNASEDCMLESLGDEVVSWERWAGPSYINSPPPSALPLPRFSRKELTAQSSVGSDLFEEFASDQASLLSSSISPPHACFSGHGLMGIDPDVVTSATKDLKRILNLDLCRT